MRVMILLTDGTQLETTVIRTVDGSHTLDCMNIGDVVGWKFKGLVK